MGIDTLSLPVLNCVILGELLSFSVPQFLDLQLEVIIVMLRTVPAVQHDRFNVCYCVLNSV